MRAFLYYFTHSFVGAIRKLFHNKILAVILAFILGFALIGGIVGVTLGVVISSVSKEETSQTETVEEADAPQDNADDEMTASEREKLFRVLEGAVSACLLFILLLLIYTGDKSGVKIFQMADVNFLFSSPMRPQSVLLFRTLMQMGVAFLSSLYLLGQLPNLINNMGLSLPQALCLFLAWIMALFIGKMASVFAYTVSATYPKCRKIVKPLVLTIGALPVLAVIGLVYFGKRGIFDAFTMIFAPSGTRWIPLFGWFRGFIMSLLFAHPLSALGYLAALVGFCAVFCWLIWRIKADFYEDALQGANELQAKLEERKKGVKARKKERSGKIARNTEMRGEGAQMFFTKTVYNRRRFAKFTLITPTSVTYAGIAALLGAFLRFAIGTQVLLPVGIVFCFVVFFRNLGNPLADEVNHPFFFLTPESSFKKVWYAAAGGLYESFLDIFPAFFITQILMKDNMPELFEWLALWLSLDFFCSLSGLFTELLLPSSVPNAIKQMLAVSVRMLAILPGVLVLLLGLVIGLPAAIGCAVLLNLAFSAGLLASAPRFLHAGKN